MMVGGREDERLALLFSQSLKRAGIKVQVRAVDAVQFEARRIGFDRWPAKPSSRSSRRLERSSIEL